MSSKFGESNTKELKRIMMFREKRKQISTQIGPIECKT